MDWQHEVSVDWLKARQDVVTATELIGLMSGRTKWTKAQKAGTEVVPAFAALWGQKHSIMDPDPRSYGPAARGHILEPYAVADYVALTGNKYYHWDDCIICNNGLGFSPDAMTLPQGEFPGVRFDVEKGKLVGRFMKGTKKMPMPESILEVKSYGIENHMKNMVTKKESLKERYQIAVAMMVLPGLKSGVLVQYCPQLSEWSMFERVYTREDLEKEIEELSEVLDMWNKTCRWFDSHTSELEATWSEKDIIEEYISNLPGNTIEFSRS